MTKCIFGVVALLFAVTAASACPGDKAQDGGKDAPNTGKPTTSLIAP